MNQGFSFSTPFDDPVLIFALVMLIILLAPLVFRKFRIPGIVGLILSGTVVGPGMLGLIERDFTIELLGTVGLLYLMFMAGLSIDLNRFEKLRNRSIGFGIISFTLPAAGALFAGHYLLDFSLATSFLLGSIVGSHTLLAYPIAERLGITKNTAVTMALGGTLVTDTLSLGILAIVAGTVVEATGAGYWFRFVGSIALFVTAAILILPRLGRWFFRTMKQENNVDFVFMVAVLFTTAYLAEVAGLASIIGAFLAGLLMNRLVPGSGTLMSRIQFVGNALFIPFFLISVGMLVDVTVLTGLDVWIKALLFTALVFAGKGLASLAVRYLYNYNNAEALVVFGLTTPQSAATLAVTLLGFELGFFDQTTVNAVVIMILFTVLGGPWLVEQYGRAVAAFEEQKPYEPSESPQRILVPLANPETSDVLMDLAFMVRRENSDQPVMPLTVARDGVDVDSQVARGEKMLSHAVVHAAAAEVPVNPITRIDLNIAQGITRAVNETLASIIIIGWNGERSAKQKIFGSILDQLLNDVDEKVLVCKIEKPVNTFERVLLAIPPFAELEQGFAEAVETVKLMASQMGAELCIVSAEERHEEIKKKADELKPELDIQYQKVAGWLAFPHWLDETQQENDLLVLLSAREGSLSWRPALERLPRVIAQRYPQLSFITLYPTETADEETRKESARVAQLLNVDHVKMDLEKHKLEHVLDEILTLYSPIVPDERERFVRRLLKNSADYSPEMLSGVVLYDAHTSLVEEPVLLIGIDREGVNVPKAANNAHVFILVLTPKSYSTEGHLKTVKTAARLIRPGRSMEEIMEQVSPADIVKLLSAPVENGTPKAKPNGE
ncbi:MAG: cation:proton antiporter [Balneolaceae bacterium]